MCCSSAAVTFRQMCHPKFPMEANQYSILDVPAPAFPMIVRSLARLLVNHQNTCFRESVLTVLRTAIGIQKEKVLDVIIDEIQKVSHHQLKNANPR